VTRTGDILLTSTPLCSRLKTEPTRDNFNFLSRCCILLILSLFYCVVTTHSRSLFDHWTQNFYRGPTCFWACLGLAHGGILWIMWQLKATCWSGTLNWHVRYATLSSLSRC